MPEPAPWGHPPRPQRKASRLGFALWIGALAALGLLLWALPELFPTGKLPWEDTADLIRMVVILIAISSGLLFIRQVNLKETARNILMWTGIMGILVLGFSYQYTLQEAFTHLRSSLVPGYPIQTAEREMVISENASGSYMVYGKVNNVRVRFLIDTGASDIVLTPSDARRVGIDFDLLDFSHPYETANGTGKGAHTNVRELLVGNAQFQNVAVSINQAEMSASLLGMTFLKRFKSFSFSQGKLTLKY
ncbi:MAG TPA: TIGR02281 family clan AA aspartic protease [Rhizomicrobium sp.]|jgi:aspartyl protease family protein